MKMVKKKNDFNLEMEKNRKKRQNISIINIIWTSLDHFNAILPTTRLDISMESCMSESAKLWNDTCQTHEAYQFLRYKLCICKLNGVALLITVTKYSMGIFLEIHSSIEHTWVPSCQVQVLIIFQKDHECIITQLLNYETVCWTSQLRLQLMILKSNWIPVLVLWHGLTYTVKFLTWCMYVTLFTRKYTLCTICMCLCIWFKRHGHPKCP